MNSSTFNRKVKKILVSTFAAGLVFAATALPTFADTVGPINFETYSLGSISGQDGWSNAVNQSYDQAVVSNTFGFSSFGSQTFRMSDGVTSGSFGDWVFVKPLTDGVGETGATAGSFSIGTRQTHFEMQFDIASTQNTEQSGLHVSVSPDRGDGSRMSYLRFDDKSDGIHVMFDDVQGTVPMGTDDCTTTVCGNFVETDVATIDRNPHTVKLTLDTLEGPANDIVKVYVDGVLKHTGTSWEDYYRYDPESSAEQSPRIVKTMIMQARGDAHSGNTGKGFVFDNISLSSSTPVPPSVPAITVPANGAHITSAALVKVDWTDSTGTNSPFEYQYEAYGDSGYSSLIYSSGWLSVSEIPTPGTPVGDYWVRVRAKDSTGVESAWSNGSGNPYHFTVVPLVGPPTLVSECKNNGWQTFNNPSFANQGACVSYVRAHSHSVLGNVKYTAYGLQRSAQFAADTADGGGAFQYSDANHAWYRVLITSLKVDGHNAWFAGKVWQASNPSWVGNWLFAKVNDSSPKRIWGSFTTKSAAESGVSSMGMPADGPFNTIGALVVH